MQITLAKDVETFVQAQVKAGVSSSAADLVNDAIRAFSVQSERPFGHDAEIEAWLLEAAEGATTPLTPSDFAVIRERVRGRLAGRGL